MKILLCDYTICFKKWQFYWNEFSKMNSQTSCEYFLQFITYMCSHMHSIKHENKNDGIILCLLLFEMLNFNIKVYLYERFKLTLESIIMHWKQYVLNIF